MDNQTRFSSQFGNDDPGQDDLCPWCGARPLEHPLAIACPVCEAEEHSPAAEVGR